jgi:hypothetical protein
MLPSNVQTIMCLQGSVDSIIKLAKFIKLQLKVIKELILVILIYKERLYFTKKNDFK